MDGFQRQQKEVLFEQLYVLWTTDGLISERNATKQFEDNSPFILESILETFDEKRKQYMITIESIHNSLKNGQPYMTTDDKVIHCTIDEKKKYRSLYYKNNNNLKYHFNELLGEFIQYINEKNSPFLPIVPLIKSIETELLVPDPPAPRESLERNAKAEAVVPDISLECQQKILEEIKRKEGEWEIKRILMILIRLIRIYTSIYFFIIKLSLLTGRPRRE